MDQMMLVFNGEKNSQWATFVESTAGDDKDF